MTGSGVHWSPMTSLGGIEAYRYVVKVGREETRHYLWVMS